MTISKTILGKYRIPLLAVLVFAVMSFTNEYFCTPYNIYGILDASSSYGIVALGLTFVIICGQLDISMGSTLALTTCVFMLTVEKLGFIPAMLLMLALGCVCGAFTGFFVASFRLSPFIVSMTMQLIYKGIALAITDTYPVSLMHPVLVTVNKMVFFNAIPATFLLFVALAILCEFILRNTQYGRNLYVVGGNINVADNLGLNVRKYLWSVYIIQGFFAALGGMVMLARTFSASGNLAMDAPLTIIPMVIIGGTAFSGGKGGTLNTLYGVLLLVILFNAMSMFSIQVNIQQLVKGLILLIIIVADKYMENRHQKI